MASCLQVPPPVKRTPCLLLRFPFPSGRPDACPESAVRLAGSPGTGSLPGPARRSPRILSLSHAWEPRPGWDLPVSRDAVPATRSERPQPLCARLAPCPAGEFTRTATSCTHCCRARGSRAAVTRICTPPSRAPSPNPGWFWGAAPAVSRCRTQPLLSTPPLAAPLNPTGSLGHPPTAAETAAPSPQFLPVTAKNPAYLSTGGLQGQARGSPALAGASLPCRWEEKLQ